MLLAFLAALLYSGGCDVPAGPDRAPDYPFRLRTRQVLRWPVGASVRVWVDPDGRGRDAPLVRAFAAAARSWNRAAWRGEYRIERTRRLADADVVLVWSDAAWPVGARACPAAPVGSAVTAFCLSEEDPGRLATFPGTSGARPTPTGVRMVVAIDAGAVTGPAHVERVVAHELGHVLGIGAHSPNPADLMWAGRLRTAAPTAADRATIHALYATPIDIRP